jgi:NitT/TauT family transport system substrate-binding protein
MSQSLSSSSRSVVRADASIPASTPASTPTSAGTSRRRLLQGGAAAAVLGFGASNTAFANMSVRFVLDWRFEGPSAFFLNALEKGYFKNEGLNVDIDVGTGSPAAIQRVASRVYDMGFGDFTSMTEFLAANPNTPERGCMGVYCLYEFSPATAFALKGKGINTPKDLVGKKLGAPVFDGGRKAFPIFAKATGIDPKSINWTSMDPTLRETMLVRGEVDAITGFLFSGQLSLEARGVKKEDMVIMQYKDFGVDLYGSTIIANPLFLSSQPDAVQKFVNAMAKSVREVVANPAPSIEFVRKRNPVAQADIELRRLQLCIDNFVKTPHFARAGVGAVDMRRLQRTTDQVRDALGLTTPVAASSLFTDRFLPVNRTI